jgi:hypothetical protein
MDESVLRALGCKSIDDYDCLCSQEGPQMQNLIKSCLIEKCGLSTAAKLPELAKELCECVGEGMRDEL